MGGFHSSPHRETMRELNGDDIIAIHRYNPPPRSPDGGNNVRTVNEHVMLGVFPHPNCLFSGHSVLLNQSFIEYTIVFYIYTISI